MGHGPTNARHDRRPLAHEAAEGADRGANQPLYVTRPRYVAHNHNRLHAVLTNKNQQGAYRGFGAEVSNWMLERLVDLAAHDLGLDRVEIRRRNLIAADQFPYRTPTGNIYDSGNYQGVLEKVLAAVDYDHWVAERFANGVQHQVDVERLLDDFVY